MIIKWPALLSTSLYGFFFLGCCFFVGYFVQVIHRKRVSPVSLDYLFWYLFYGLITITSIFAIVITQFKTSLLPIPFLLATLLRLHLRAYPSANLQSRLNKKDLTTYCVCFLLYWFFFALHFVVFNNNKVSYIGGDTAFYGRAAEYLNYTRQENVSLDFFNIIRNLEPYHYGDLWSIAFIQKLTGINPILMVHTVVYPAFALIFTIGLTSYAKAVFHIKENVNLVCLVSPFVSGFTFLFPKFLLRADIYSITLVSYPKYLFIACLLIAILLSVKYSNKTHTLLLMTISAISFINIAPALFLFVALAFITTLIAKKRWSVPPVVLLLVVVSVLYYGLFYLYNGSLPDSGEYKLRFETKTAVNILLGSGLQLFPFLPFLVLLVYTHNKAKNSFKSILASNFLFPLALLVIAGLLAWSILYPLSIESSQFFFNLFVPLMTISISLITIHTLLQSKRNLVPLLIVASSILLHLKFTEGLELVDRDDFLLCSRFIRKHDKGNFANIQNPSLILSKNTVVYQPLSFISYLLPTYCNVSLNVTMIPVNENSIYAHDERLALQTSPFFAFFKNAGADKSLEQIAFQFIIEKNVRYISVGPKAQLFNILTPLAKDSVKLSTGWSIYLLDLNK